MDEKNKTGEGQTQIKGGRKIVKMREQLWSRGEGWDGDEKKEIKWTVEWKKAEGKKNLTVNKSLLLSHFSQQTSTIIFCKLQSIIHASTIICLKMSSFLIYAILPGTHYPYKCNIYKHFISMNFIHAAPANIYMQHINCTMIQSHILSQHSHYSFISIYIYIWRTLFLALTNLVSFIICPLSKTRLFFWMAFSS